MSVQRAINNIPPADIDTVVQHFESEGCTTIKQQQADGNWTVVATRPNGS